MILALYELLCLNNHIRTIVNPCNMLDIWPPWFPSIWWALRAQTATGYCSLPVSLPQAPLPPLKAEWQEQSALWPESLVSIFSFHSPSRIHKVTTETLKNHLMQATRREGTPLISLLSYHLKMQKKKKLHTLWNTHCAVKVVKLLLSYHFVWCTCLYYQKPWIWFPC